MPYCCQCGKRLQDADAFCGGCGARQPVAAGAAAGRPDLLPGITPRSASVLCYIPLVGWIAAIIVLASQRFRHYREVRFHAFQGLYLFVVWLIVDWVIGPIFGVPGLRHAFPLGKLLKLGLIAVWVAMIIKASRDETYRLPIIGEMADRSVSEQR